ncbi:ycf20-like protein isoform X3 [Papaver somniferum]|uniref:ycf20-like protein isoform X3 n=1 Tax=Papaver somniferum TaxID=3469 RepID=UPI000E7005F7|nr:ycf20-like protein isoform X3 [Papaver somniferum]
MTLVNLRNIIFVPQFHSRFLSESLETLAQVNTLSTSTDYLHFSSILRRRQSWSIALALNTGGTPDGGNQDNLNANSGSFGRTRLGRIVGAGGKQLLAKLNSARKNVPVKVFLLLLGFYTANALATILGQTGDWDVLVAGVVVAAIEGIGMLMYKKTCSFSTGRFQPLIV